MPGIIGFHATNLNKLVDICEAELGRDRVQLLTPRDAVLNRRCYIILGVDTLKAKINLLKHRRATLIVLDTAPLLIRIEGVKILDASDLQAVWSLAKPKFGLLIRALHAKPKPLAITISDDATMNAMIEKTRSRGILAPILAAAKQMKTEHRSVLYHYVSRYITGAVNLNTLKRRALDDRGVRSDASANVIKIVQSEIAKRLGKAIIAFQDSGDAKLLAAKLDVDAFEIRYLGIHLNNHKEVTSKKPSTKPVVSTTKDYKENMPRTLRHRSASSTLAPASGRINGKPKNSRSSPAVYSRTTGKLGTSTRRSTVPSRIRHV